MQNILSIVLETGRKLNVHKTFRRRPGRLMYVQFIFCDYGMGGIFDVLLESS